MSRPRESRIQRTCNAYAAARGCLVFRLRPPPAGVPDVLYVLPTGAVLWVEFKRGRRATVRARQIYTAANLTERGQRVLRATSAREFKATLDSILRGE